MISHALKKLPNNKVSAESIPSFGCKRVVTVDIAHLSNCWLSWMQGTLKDILKIIENDFNDELIWKLEG